MTQKLCLLQCSEHESLIQFWCVLMWNVKEKNRPPAAFLSDGLWGLFVFFEDFLNHCDLTVHRKDKLDKSWGCHIDVFQDFILTVAH